MNKQRHSMFKNMCHNPYFNRWFSAISVLISVIPSKISHNPYFNRWFSAIKINYQWKKGKNTSQSLF